MAVVGLTCSEVCRLFCCPPCPSNIAAKLAFIPPEPSTYSITMDEDDKESLHLTERAEFLFSQRELGMIEAMKVRTRRRNYIACMYVKVTENAKYTLLFSHGNAVDLGQMSSYYVGLGTRIGCNVFGYDYSGYGDSTGSASEANIYADAEAAWETMTTRLKLDPMHIIIYGQSIGSVASVDLATKHECAGVILHSPLLSGMRVAFPDVSRTYFFDPFPSITKILRVLSVVLVIHGTEDEVIDFSHGLCLYERAPNTVEPLWVDGAGHNDIERYSAYLLRLIKFVSRELPARAAAAKEKAAKASSAPGNSAGNSAGNGAGNGAAKGGATGAHAIGDDGVMALAAMDDDDDEDESGDVGTGSAAETDGGGDDVVVTVAGGNGSSTDAAPSASTTTTSDITESATEVQAEAEDDEDAALAATSTDALITDSDSPQLQHVTSTTSTELSGARPSSATASAATADRSTGSDSAAAPSTSVLSASEQSLPLSVDCADRPPNGTPDQPSVTVAVTTSGKAEGRSATDSGTLVYV